MVLMSASRAPAYVILAVFLVAMVAIAVFTHKKSNSLNSFFLSDRGVGGWLSAFAYGTTYFSSVIFIGYAGQFGMSMGLSSIWIGVSNAIIGSLLAWMVLAKRTRRMSHALGTKTMPEFFEKRYDSKGLKLFSAIIIFIFLIPYSTSVYQGLGYIIESVFGIPFIWCILIIAVFTAAYLFSGGYFATALTDFIQGCIMLFGVALMLILMFNSSQVNWGEGVRKLTDMGFGFLADFQGSGKWYDSPGFTLIIMCLLTSFGIWALPQSVHKFYAIKDEKAIKRGTVISTLFALIIGGGAYLNGGLAHLFFQTPPDGSTERVVTGMFEAVGFPSVMMGLIAVLVMSASMSTLSSLSLSGSSALSIDVYQGYIRKRASENEVKWVLRALCLAFIGISAILAILQIDAIVTLMSLSWGTISGCFIGPYVWGLYWKRTTKAGVWAGMVSGLVITLFLVLLFGFLQTDAGTAFGTVLKTGIKRAPHIGVLTMITSMVVTPVVSLFTKPPKAETVENSFQTIGK